jgi:HK97 family phage portal protein
MPLDVMRQDGGRRVKENAHQLYNLLAYEPNAEMTATDMRESMTAHLVNRGNAYARIARSGDRIISLWPLSPDSVQPGRDDTGALVYNYTTANGDRIVMPMRDVLHVRGLSFDGIRGYDVITVGREAIATAQSAEDYAAKFFARGGRRPGILHHPKAFRSAEDFKAFRSSWEEVYGSGLDSFHKTPILENGMEFKESDVNPEQMQLISTRQYSVSDVCRLYRISPYMVGELSRATFNNIEQLSLEFVKYSLMVWLVRWEQAIRRCCLTDLEKARGYYVKHNVNALMRGDLSARMASYATALQNGIYSPNEVRELEDRDAYDGGDARHIQLNMQTIGAGEMTASQVSAIGRQRTAGA